MAQHNYGVDLGTSNIKFVCETTDKIINEKNVIAIKDKKNIFSFGDLAYDMFEKNPAHINIINPVKYGVIADIKNMELLFECFYKKINESKNVSGGSFCIAVPTDITDVEKRAFYNLIALSKVKAKSITVVEKPIADAVGVGIDIDSPKGNLIVNIGADTTEISVISLGGIVISKIIKIAGVKLDEMISAAVKKNYNLVIGSKTAEQIKIKLANALENTDSSISVYGRNLVSGLPIKCEVESELVYNAIKESLHSIVDSIKIILERTPPELSADIIDTGIFVTGGSSAIKNIDKLIKKETGLNVNIVNSPSESIIRGIKTILSDQHFSSVKYVPREKEYK